MYKIIGQGEPILCNSKEEAEKVIRQARDNHISVQWANLSGIRQTRWLSVNALGEVFHTYSDNLPFEISKELPDRDSIMASW